MFAAAFDILEGIEFRIDRIVRAANGVEHRGKGLGTIVKYGGAIAGDERFGRHRLLGGQMTIENVAVRRLPLQRVENFSATRRAERSVRADDGL